MSVSTWIRQPTTILGLGVGLGTVAATAVYYFTGNPEYAAAAAGAVFTALHVGINDNSALPTDVEKLAIDSATALLNKRLTAAAPALFTDAVAVANDLRPTPTLKATQ